MASMSGFFFSDAKKKDSASLSCRRGGGACTSILVPVSCSRSLSAMRKATKKKSWIERWERNSGHSVETHPCRCLRFVYEVLFFTNCLDMSLNKPHCNVVQCSAVTTMMEQDEGNDAFTSALVQYWYHYCCCCFCYHYCCCLLFSFFRYTD